jgi:hypothetical protein
MPFVAAAHARRSSSNNNPDEQSDFDRWMIERAEKKELDKKNKPEALQNRTQEYKVIVMEPKELGIELNRDHDSNNDNYITIEHTKPNPYNIIQYSKLVSYKYDSTEIMLEELTGKELEDAFKPLSGHIQNIKSNDESTYVTLTFKSNKPHIQLYPYSVTLTSDITMGIRRKDGKDINNNDVIIIEIKDSNTNPYGITDGSRLVGIQYGSNYNSEFVPITYHTTDYDDFRERKVEVDPLDVSTHITLYFVSDNPKAPGKAQQQGEAEERLEQARYLQRRVKLYPELLKNRDKIYQITLKEFTPLGIILNSDYNYINVMDTKPNPHNIIEYSKLVSYKYDSTEIMLEELTGKELEDAFGPVKTHIEAIQPNNESTYVTLTLKSNRVHKPLLTGVPRQPHSYSVTLTSNKRIGFRREKRMYSNGIHVTILRQEDSTYNPYGITDGSRLVTIQYRNFYDALLDGVSMTSLEPDPVYEDFVTKQEQIDTQNKTKYIILNLESEDSGAPVKAANAVTAAKAAVRAAKVAARTEAVMKPINAAKKVVMKPINAVTSTAKKLFNPYSYNKLVEPEAAPESADPEPDIGGGKSRKTKRHRKKSTHRKTKRHRHRKKSRRNKKTHRNKH